jgi:predicted alpha/beta-hydrolase family hydrolase
MGGRIASQIAPTEEGLTGLVFLGYPLHPPGKPAQLRAKHLLALKAPMLFVQGARDAFGTPDELRPLLSELCFGTELYSVEGGDHSFRVPKNLGPQAEVMNRAKDVVARWVLARARSLP